MWSYQKKLEYPVNIKNTNPKLAAYIVSQYGGPHGEIGASLRYLSQRYSMPNGITKALLTDIGMSFTILHIYNKRDISAQNLTYIPCRVVLYHFKT